VTDATTSLRRPAPRNTLARAGTAARRIPDRPPVSGCCPCHQLLRQRQPAPSLELLICGSVVSAPATS